MSALSHMTYLTSYYEFHIHFVHMKTRVISFLQNKSNGNFVIHSLFIYVEPWPTTRYNISTFILFTRSVVVNRIDELHELFNSDWIHVEDL